MNDTMRYAIIPVTSFVQNCTLLYCNETRRGAVVDPGGDIERITAQADALDVTIEKILLTHGHLDHVGGVAALARQLQIPVAGPHLDDRFLLEGLSQQSALLGLPMPDAFTPDQWLNQGDRLALGNGSVTVLHCPGHTPGHVVFYSSAARLAIVGDVLFKGSIGRTDLPRGDHAALLQSIVQQLWPLGDDTRFIPGHGPLSTFGEERRSNPFVADHVIQA